jgi:hypothetical protein
MKNIRSFIALVLIATSPLNALAQQHGGGGQHGGQQGRPSGPSRPSQPSQPQRPPSRPAQPQPGYNLNNDTRRPPNNRPPSRPPVNNPGFRPPPPNNRPPVNRPPNPSFRPPGYRPSRPPVVIGNPVWHGRPAWGWNRGIVWGPSALYWGGGFWGTLAIAAAQAAIFGYIVGPQGQQWVSYQVQPSSPGAQLLQAYGLQQTPCGPPNLVVIYGPNNSVICAFPNNLVAPGVYSVDPSTLTISSF